MNKIVVDSTVWIDFFNARLTPHTSWLRQNIASTELRIIDLSLCEVLQGARTQVHFEQIRSLLLSLGVLSTGGENLAIRSAELYRLLRARGITVRKTIDCLIATHCIAQGCVLLHNDRDFDPFEEHLGLRVIHPPPML